MKADLRIEATDKPGGVKIWLNGRKLENVYELKLNFPLGGVMSATISQYPSSLKVRARNAEVKLATTCPNCGQSL